MPMRRLFSSVVIIVLSCPCQRLARCDERLDHVASSPSETFAIAPCGDVPVVSIEALGRKLRFIVNTVVPQTVFAKKHRRLLGDPVADGHSSHVRTADRSFEIYKAPPMRLGSRALKIETVAVADCGNEERIGFHFDGLLGLDVLRQYVVRFDFDRGALQFLDSVPEDSGEELALIKHKHGILGVEVSLGDGAAQLFTPATATRASVAMQPTLFTTCCRNGTVQLPDQISLAVASKSQSGVQGVAACTKLGPFTHRQIQVETAEANYLGLNYLSRYIIVFDFPHERAYFKKSQTYNAPSTTENSGLYIVWRNGEFVVDGIWPMSPASESGILCHDVIRRINDEPAEKFSLFELRRSLQNERQTVSMTIRRDERIVDLKIELRDFHNAKNETRNKPPSERKNARSPNEVLAEVAVAKYGEPLAVPLHLKDVARPLLMLLDTGASMTTYDQRLRSRLGTNLGRADVNTPYGVIRDDFARAPATWLGKIELSRESVCLVSDLKRIREATGYDFDGILGMDQLRNQIMQIDFDNGTLRLLSDVPIGAGQSFPIEYFPSGTPAVIADVGSSHGEWFVLDTGCMMAGSAVAEKLFQQLSVSDEIINIEQIWHGDESRTRGFVGDVSVIALGPFHHQSLKVAASTNNAFGLAYMSRYLVTFDFPRRTVYLKQARGYNRPEKFEVSILSVVKRDNAYVVDRVPPASPAEYAGFRAGDAVVRVNGQRIADLSVLELQQMFVPRVKDIKVIVVRDAREVILTIGGRPEKNGLTE